jgi:beta-glucosidase-like glycosyl hydrolase
VGGFIVGVGPSYSTASFLNELQGGSKVPLLMTADLEWGPGTRLRGATVLPINMAIGAAGAPSLAYEAGRITGLEARAAGLHVAYAPVADVNVNPRNPVINTRAYGGDAALVSARVVEFVRGARSAGLLTVAKHFPGHGDTEVDSHIDLPIIHVDRRRADVVELVPFRAAVDAGVAGVMSAHIAFPALAGDSTPATLSHRLMTGLLQEELGFRGLVITDALDMGAIVRRYGKREAAVLALEAGADILLMPPELAPAVEAVVAAVESGRVTESRIDHSVRKLLRAKAELDLARMLTRRLSVMASTLRARSVEEKAALAREVETEVWPGFADGSLRPVVDRTYPLAEAAAAHARMESSAHIGKLILTVP